MAAVCVYSPTIGALKFALKERFPTVKSSHLTEALAAALGFRTHAALQTAFSPNIPTRVAVLRDKWFVERLVEFEYSAPEIFSFDAVELQQGTPISSLLVEIEPASLWAMGQENSDLYHLCRTLQERGSKLPTFISHKSIMPLLAHHGLMKDGYTTISLRDMNRHVEELESLPIAEEPGQKGAQEKPNLMVLDFTKSNVNRTPTAEDERDVLRRDLDKVLIKGIPPTALWAPLKNLVFSGTLVEFAEVFNRADLDSLREPETAAHLAGWRNTLSEIADLYKFAYDVNPEVRLGATIASLNSLDQQFVTTIAALRRRDHDAAAKTANLLVDLGKANLQSKNRETGELLKMSAGGHPGVIFSGTQVRAFRPLPESVQHLVIPPSGKAESILDKIRPADRLALQEWAAQQQPSEGGSVDMMRWPGWAAAVANRIVGDGDTADGAEDPDRQG